MKYHLLTEQRSSPKLEHSSEGRSAQYLSAVLYLAPHKLSGRNLCPNATPGCIASCLNLAGRGGIMKPGETSNQIQRARILRSKRFIENRDVFLFKLQEDILKLSRVAIAQGKRAAVRLNGTSDIPWENMTIFPERKWLARFPEVQFYDYTKSRMRLALPGDIPSNYALTYSRSERDSDDEISDFLKLGWRVSIVVDSVPYWTRERLLRRFPNMRYRVEGDASDYHFLDRPGTVSLLRAKGPAVHDRTGFVLRAP